MSGKQGTTIAITLLVLFFGVGFWIANRPSNVPRLVEQETAMARVEPPASLGLEAERQAPTAPASKAEDNVAPTPAPPPLGSLRVTAVWDSGDPAAGLAIIVEPRNGPYPRFEEHRGTTDAEGVVLIEGLPPGRVRVRADRADPPAGPHRPRTSIQAGETTDCILELRKHPSVDGIVVDTKGSPVPDAEVWLGERTFSNLAMTLITHSGPDGKFHLDCVESGRSIGARARGYAPSSVKAISGEPKELLKLVLPGDGGAVEGRVLTPDGETRSGCNRLRRSSGNRRKVTTSAHLLLYGRARTQTVVFGVRACRLVTSHWRLVHASGRPSNKLSRCRRSVQRR